MKSALIIEGDPAARLALLRALGRRGWMVDAVDSIESALACFDGRPPSIVLLEWQLGDISGLHLLTAMKMHPIWNAVPVVMTGRNTTADDREHACRHGANDFLQQPFPIDNALRNLDRWVSDHSSPAALSQTGRRHRG